jgi:threonine/homoserine/homoserine lactone efflux protein
LVAVAPLADSVDGVRLALQLACAAYLAFVAYKLWRFKAGAQTSAVSFRQVFWATLSNPKAMVFAFVLLPGSTGEPRFAAYAISLLGLMAVSGAVWVLAGTGVSRAAGGASDGIIRRVSSVVMASFSAIMIVGALGLR